MIIGAHSIVYSKDPDADRAFFKEVLEFPSVDVGEGWLLFGLPPAEVAVHPSEENGVHELYLMCDDVRDFVARMEERHVACAPIRSMGWGLLTSLTLPGGGMLGVYQPRHARPKPMRVGRPARKRRRHESVRSATKRRARAPKERGGKR